jgi:Protein of unknwon function (DUF3310)
MAKKETKAAKIRAYIENNSQATAREIAAATGASVATVYNIRYEKIAAQRKWEAKLRAMSELETVVVENPVADPVNHPAHYTDGGIETIDYIEAKGLGYHLGNAVKYISRAGKKGTNQGLEDLRKAQWYLARAIEKNEYAPSTR